MANLYITNDSSSNWTENGILNFLLRQADDPGHTIYTNLYASLYTADPTDNNATALANEVSGSGYARVLAPHWSVNTVTGIATLTNQINFPVATGAWGTITWFGLCTTPTAGSIVFRAVLNPDGGIYVGNQYVFSILAGESGTQMAYMENGYSAQVCGFIYNNLLNNLDISSNGLSIYAKLFTTMPSATNIGGVELPTIYAPYTYSPRTATGYNPVQVAGTSNWANPTSGSTYNLNTITLISNAKIDFGNVVGMCFYDLYWANSPQLIFLFPFENPIKVLEGDSLRFLPGELKIGAG